MARTIQYRRQITEAPMLLATTDDTLSAWLLSLGAPTFFSNTAGALWAVEVTDGTDTSDGGTAYIVSAEAAKRAEAGRLS